MEQKFNISGTLEELEIILKKEFKLSDDAAHIATAVFAFEQNQDKNQDQFEEDALYFLNGGKCDYQSSFFSARYSISFTKAMLGVFDELLIQGVLVACGKEDFCVPSVVLCCIIALKNNVRRIKDNECCVYFNAIDYVKKHSDRWFSVQQVMPNTGDDNICVNLDKDWKCKFKCGERKEECGIQEDAVRKILDTFCADDVLEPNGDALALYKFKI